MKLKKWITFLLLGCFLFSLAGCGGGTGKPEPDYSDSEANMERYGFVGPTNGRYTDANGTNKYTGEDYRTEERLREYKECGFDVLLLQGNDPYNGEDFEGSQLKKNLDNSQKVGLKVIAFDLRIHDLSAEPESLIGEGEGKFATFEALVEHIDELTAPYRNHPAFYGMTVLDEPNYEHLDALGEVYRALKTLKPDMVINVCLLPFFDSSEFIVRYAGKGTTIKYPKDAYKVYMDKCMEATGEKFLLYDNYPFRHNAQGNKDYVLATYFRNLQLMAQKSQEEGGDFGIVMQSCAMYGHREVTEADIRWQANITMSFGAVKQCYFTYWMFPNKSIEFFTQGIMDDFGNKMLYDEVQRVNREVDGTYDVVSNFKYKATYLDFAGFTAPAYFADLTETKKLTGVEKVTTDGQLLINEMRDDGKDYDGFFVINADDPKLQTTNTTTLTFEKARNVKLIHKGITSTQKLGKDRTLTLVIEPGDSYFVIPY